MKSSFLFSVCFALLTPCAHSQDNEIPDVVRKELSALIDQYAQAREEKDTVLLKRILTTDADQLVSSGEWRNGIRQSIEGMLRSSAGNPGTRKLIVDKMRLLTAATAIIDARYEIQQADGTIRKMWSTFFVVQQQGRWKISAIRNMLPSVPQK